MNSNEIRLHYWTVMTKQRHVTSLSNLGENMQIQFSAFCFAIGGSPHHENITSAAGAGRANICSIHIYVSNAKRSSDEKISPYLTKPKISKLFTTCKFISGSAPLFHITAGQSTWQTFSRAEYLPSRLRKLLRATTFHRTIIHHDFHGIFFF